MIQTSNSYNFCGIRVIIILFVIGICVAYLYTLQMELDDEVSDRNRIIVLDIEYVEKNLHNLDQKDPQLIQYTRVRHLTPPSSLPYNLKIKEKKVDIFNTWVEKFYKNHTGGIFIEAGANEGEWSSHTLYLEKELGWTGLLIECNPKVVPTLKNHNRKAWVADTCLAPSSNPGMVNFSNPMQWSYSGTFNKPWNLSLDGNQTKWESFEVPTMPLYTVIAAMGWTEIDYFSFDIEGLELKILQQFPFDLVIFKVLIVEVYFYKPNELAELDALLKSNGYIFVKDVDVDKIYVHKSVKHMLEEIA